MLTGHAQVNNGQDHENKRLQRDHQQVEDCPGYRADKLPVAHHGGQQDEDELAGKHVAEQSQTERYRLGQQRYSFENQVYRNKEKLGEALGFERMEGQLTEETANTLV